jgi:hypothetical protein
MKKLLILLTICLSSCNDPNGYPRLADQEQLIPIFRYVEIDGREYIDTEESFCASRLYRVSKGYIGSIQKPIRLHISECHKIIGRAPDEYNAFSTWLENFRNWLLGF